MAAVLNIPTDQEIDDFLRDDDRNDTSERALQIKGLAAHLRDSAEAAEIKLPVSVDHVIHQRRNRLHQVRAVIAGAFAMAEANDDSSDVRWALEVALEQLEEAIDSLEPIKICRDAADQTAEWSM